MPAHQPLPTQIPLQPCPGCTLRVTALDFVNKAERSVDVGSLRQALEGPHYLWIDVDVRDRCQARPYLDSIQLVGDDLLDEVFGDADSVSHRRSEQWLYLALVGCRPSEGSEALKMERVCSIFQNNCMITFHFGPVLFLDAILAEYSLDFVRFARGPGFLVYELWDLLAENLRQARSTLENCVERIHPQFVDHVDDALFADVSDVGAQLLGLRKVVLLARSVLLELTTRQSPFVGTKTRGFLSNLVGSLDHILADILVDRELLSDALNLHMSMITHRTNRLVTRLTAVSLVFLPLTFLCGVYGMNFVHMPEIGWRYGYLYFWGLVALVVPLLVAILRRSKLL